MQWEVIAIKALTIRNLPPPSRTLATAQFEAVDEERWR
jgi:hypothetical protein